MVSAINSALAGLATAGKRVETSAANIANAGLSAVALTQGQATGETPQQVLQVGLGDGTSNDDTRGQDTVDINAALAPADDNDLAQNMVDLTIASYDFKANLKTLQVADNMQKSLLDIVG